MALKEFDGELDQAEPQATGLRPFDGELDAPSPRAAGLADAPRRGTMRQVKPFVGGDERTGFKAGDAGGGRGFINPGDDFDAANSNAHLVTGKQLGRDLLGGVEQVKGLARAAVAFGGAADYRATAAALSDFDAIDAGQPPTATAAPGMRTNGPSTTSEPGAVARAYQQATPEQRQQLRAGATDALTRDKTFIADSVKAVQTYAAEQQKLSGKIPDFTDVNSATGFANWLTRTGVSAAPTMAAAMIGAAAGPLGFAVTSGGMAVGDLTQARIEHTSAANDPAQAQPSERAEVAANRDENMARDLAKNVGATAALAVPYAALDALGPVGKALRGPGGQIAGQTVKQVLKQGVRELPKQVGEEIINEGGQEIVNVGGDMIAGERGSDVTGADAKRVFNAGMAGAAMAPGGHVANVAHEALAAGQASPANQVANAINEQVKAAAPDPIRADAAARAALDPNPGGVNPATQPQPPIERRKQADARFDNLVAEHGMAPKAAAAVKQAAQGMPLAEVPGFYKRATQALAKRGLFRGPVDDASLGVLDEPPPPAVPPPEQAPVGIAAVPQGDLAAQAQTALDKAQPAAEPPAVPQTPLIKQTAQVAEVAPEAAQPEGEPPIVGDKLNRNWTAFAPESGTLNLPREQMPQIKADHRGALVNFLNARGIEHSSEEVPAESLKPTQREFSPQKVRQAGEFTGGDRSILVSADNHVVDGHHQWLAKMQAGEPVKVIRLNAPIQDVLRLAHQFPSSTTASSPAQPRTTTASVPAPSVETPAAAPAFEHKQNADGTVLVLGKPAEIKAALPSIPGITGTRGVTFGKSQAEKVVEALNAAPAERAAPTTKPVEVWTGVGKKGMLRHSAQQQMVDQRRKHPGLEWTVAPAPEFGDDKFKLEGRKPAKATDDQNQSSGTRAEAKPKAAVAEAPTQAADAPGDTAASAAAQPAGRAATRAAEVATDGVKALRKKWPGLDSKPDAVVIASEAWDQASHRLVRESGNHEAGSAIHDKLVDELGQKKIAADQVGYLSELTKRLNVAADAIEADRQTYGTLANRREAKASDKANEARNDHMHKANLEEIDLALQQVRDMHAQGRITDGDLAELVNISETSKDSFETATRLHDLLESKMAAREASGIDKGNAANEPSRDPADTKFQRTKPDDTAPQRAPDPVRAAAQAYVDKLRAGWKNAPPVIVIDSMEDAPEAARRADSASRQQDAKGEPAAFIHRGTVYVVARKIRSIEGLAESVFHEAFGHYGLRGVFGNSLDTVLRQTATALPDKVKAKAAAYGLDINDEKQRLVAAEEVLAELAQTRPSSTWVTKAIAAIRGWLRDTFPALKDWKLSDAEIIEKFIIPARNYVERGEAADQVDEGSVAFSRSTDMRSRGLPAGLVEIHGARNTDALKEHPDYKAAKAGDMEAAARLVRDLVKPSDIQAARDKIGEGAQWVYPHAEEATGRNMIPAMMAALYASATDGTVAAPIVQANQVFHTGADAMQRLMARPVFDGPVTANARYAIVDDVTTMGGTLAEMANHIQEGGGVVAGVVTLANSDRSPTLPALKPQITAIENRYGQTLRDYFHIDPAALTRSEAGYVLGFRDADALKARAASAERARSERLRSKGISAEDQGLSDGADAPDVLFQRTPPGQPGQHTLQEFGKSSAFIEAIQDRYNRWKQAVTAVRKQGGVVTEANDFYRAEERYWGKVGSQIDDFHDEMNAFVKAVSDDHLDLASVALYAYAQHAQERNEWIADKRPAMTDGGSGMTTADANQILDEARQSGTEPDLQKHAATLRAWIKGTRDTLLSNGLIDQAEHDAWENMFQNYVPLRGLDGKTEGKGTGRGFDVRGKEGKEAKGRKSQAKDIIEQIVQDRTRALVRSGKNEVLRSFLQFVLDNPSPNLWAVNAVQSSPVSTVDANGNRVLEEGTATIKDERTVAVKDGGKEIHILVKDQRLREQLQNLHVEDIGRVVGAMMYVNRMLSRLYTSLSPTFTVLNGARDLLESSVNIIDELGFLAAPKLWANMPKSLIESYRAEFGKKSVDYQAYRMTGGKTGFFDLKNIDTQAAELQALLKDADRSWFNPKKAGRKALHIIEAINGGIENATRLAAFKTAIGDGKSQAEAARISKNISVNFNRKGTMSPTLGAWFLFFNPAVQGTARVAQALQNPKVLATLGFGMLGVASLALMNAGMGDDDDGVAWWDKVPDEVKERNIVIMLPPGSTAGSAVPGSKIGRYLKVPMPYGYSFFAAVANQVADGWRHEQDPKRGRSKAEALVKTINAFLNSFIPVQELSKSVENPKSAVLASVPDALNPIAQNVLNVNSFGRKMYPDDRTSENQPDSSRYFPGSSGTIFQRGAEGLNKATGGTRYQSGLLDLTPASLENLARGYGGGPANFGLDVLNALYVRQNISRPDLDTRRLPFIKQLYGVIDDESDRVVGQQRMDKVQAVLDPLHRAMKEGASTEAKAMAKDAGAIAGLGEALKSTHALLGQVRKAELATISSEKDSEAQKFDKLQVLAGQRRKILQGFNRAYDQAIEMQAAQTPKQPRPASQREAVAP